MPLFHFDSYVSSSRSQVRKEPPKTLLRAPRLVPPNHARVARISDWLASVHLYFFGGLQVKAEEEPLGSLMPVSDTH